MKAACVSVAIPTCNRLTKLRVSLQRISACKPPPAELLVHVDAGDFETARHIRSQFTDVRLLESETPLGPGGGRNRLVAAATCPYVASFDDDSYPMDTDYFACLERTFDQFPEAGVVAAHIFHENELIQARGTSAAWVAEFVGCGCAYRRDAFNSTTGYVPLRIAYGMEEVDLSLRLYDRGWRVLETDALRVFHATCRRNQANPAVTGASIANLALLAFLRYPATCWWIGVGQVYNRVAWLMRNGRSAGVLAGIAAVPMHLWRHRRFRALVKRETLVASLGLRRQLSSLKSAPVSLTPTGQLRHGSSCC